MEVWCSSNKNSSHLKLGTLPSAVFSVQSHASLPRWKEFCPFNTNMADFLQEILRNFRTTWAISNSPPDWGKGNLIQVDNSCCCVCRNPACFFWWGTAFSLQMQLHLFGDFARAVFAPALRFSFRQHTFCEPSVVVDFASPLGIPASPQKACPGPLFWPLTTAGHSPQQCKQGLQCADAFCVTVRLSKSSVKCLVTCLPTIDTQRGGQPSSDQTTCSGTSNEVAHLKIL